jgi:hypothetical protein
MVVISVCVCVCFCVRTHVCVQGGHTFYQFSFKNLGYGTWTEQHVTIHFGHCERESFHTSLKNS